MIKPKDNKDSKDTNDTLDNDKIKEYEEQINKLIKENSQYKSNLEKLEKTQIAEYQKLLDDSFNKIAQLSKELNEALKKVAYNKENESFYQQFLKFTKNRWDLFISSLEKYKCKLLDDYKKSIDPEEKKKKHN